MRIAYAAAVIAITKIIFQNHETTASDGYLKISRYLFGYLNIHRHLHKEKKGGGTEMSKKKTEAVDAGKKEAKREPKKRVRRNPELLIEELDEKLKRLEVKVYRRNADYIQQIGIEILKMIDYKFARITDEDRADIGNMTAKGREKVRKIVAAAYEAMQE